MATRKFVHHAATPGLLLTIADGKIVDAQAFKSFASTVYVREAGKPGYVTVPVHSCRDFVVFDDLLTSEPEPIAIGAVMPIDVIPTA